MFIQTNTSTIKNKPGAIIIEGHVQGLSNTRSLGEMGVPVYVVDKTNCIARYSKYCKKFFRCPDFISDDFVPFLIDLAKNENIKDWVLIPSNDHAVYSISKHKTELEKYYKIITTGIEIIDKIYDKARLIDVAKKEGIPVPITEIFSTTNQVLQSNIEFPVITKGRHGLSFYKAVRKKALLSNNPQELQKNLEVIEKNYPLNSSFTQELIPFNGTNKTISFTAFCVNGEIKTHWTGVKLREHPLQFGTATFTKSIYVEACHKQSILLLKALSYTGVCEVEYLLDPRDNAYKLIEINARTWLWVGLAKACGVDYAKMIYHYVHDMEYDYPEQYEVHRYWINPVTDTVFAGIGILKGQLNILKYFASIFKKKKTNALFSKKDFKPGFAYFLNIFSFFKNR
ncbi:MAG: hypothetical protein ACLFVR_08640 [Thiohalospira sp.]